MATRSYGDGEFELLREWLDGNQDSRSEQLVERLQDAIGAEYPCLRVVATNSCMGALHLALQTAGVRAGDEVIVDPIVVFGGMAAMYENAVPVWADVDERTYNLDPASVADRVTPRTKAIICTHHFGSVCEMEALAETAREHDLALIEDCAHALYAERDGRRAGLFGHFAAFSFNHRKQLSTGQGGFLLINDERFVELSQDRDFGRVPAELSWNYAMAGVVAALALAQWPRARAYVERDRELAALYSDAVAGCEWLTPQEVPERNRSSSHIWGATFTGDEAGVDYGEFMTALRRNGADYFLPSFMPYGAFGLKPSPAYRYPLFATARASDQGELAFPAGLCPRAEELVPRLFNTVLSPVEDERVERYADGLARTIAEFS